MRGGGVPVWWEQLRDLDIAAVGVVEARADAKLAELLDMRRQRGSYPPFTPADPELRADPSRFWPEVKTIICVAVKQPVTEYQSKPPGMWGLVARSMRGPDYHREVRQRLAALAGILTSSGLGRFGWQAWVDSVPPVERELAQQAGLGRYGRNCCLYLPEIGSRFWLGELALDIALPEEWFPPSTAENIPPCGCCTRCIDACPTGALKAPFDLDPYRCLSYLSQNKKAIPKEMRPLMGLRLFGCDTCQDVCPLNAGIKPRTGEPAPPAWFDLCKLVSGEGWQQLKGSSMKWRGEALLIRNAAVVLGNTGRPEAVHLLAEAVIHPHPSVREHAAWALGRLGTTPAMRLLENALSVETELVVHKEILEALKETKTPGT